MLASFQLQSSRLCPDSTGGKRAGQGHLDFVRVKVSLHPFLLCFSGDERPSISNSLTSCPTSSRAAFATCFLGAVDASPTLWRSQLSPPLFVQGDGRQARHLQAVEHTADLSGKCLVRRCLQPCLHSEICILASWGC